MCQACAAWQWWNYYISMIPSPKAPLRLNVDETSVCLYQGDMGGNVMVSKKRAGEIVQQVPRSKRRCRLTHVGVVCDRPDIQPLLPQILILNQRTATDAQMAALRAACPANVRLIRQKSAFTNTEVCVWLLRLLGIALRPYLATLQPILLQDALRAHWHASVLNACRAFRIWPLCVPAALTWLLQPLDTHVFRKYKAFLRTVYQELRIQRETSDLNLAAFLSCVHRTIRSVLQGNRWSGAFDGVGFGGAQAHLERFVLRNVELVAPPVLPSIRPTDAQVSSCFDRRYRVDHARLWRVMQAPSTAVRLAVARAHFDPSVPYAGKVLPHRLRSEARAARAAASASSSSSAHPPPGVVGIAVAKATRGWIGNKPVVASACGWVVNPLVVAAARVCWPWSQPFGRRSPL